MCFRVIPGKGEQLKEDLDQSGERSSSSRMSSKSSSKPQRSSGFRAKESSSKKAQESKPKEVEGEVRAEAGSGDEGQGVVEAHDEEVEALGEDLVTEESVAAEPDQEAGMEFEDSAMDPEEEEKNLQDGEDAEIPEREAFEQRHQTEQTAELGEDQEQADNAELKETDGQDDGEQDEGAADDSIEQVSGKIIVFYIRRRSHAVCSSLNSLSLIATFPIGKIYCSLDMFLAVSMKDLLHKSPGRTHAALHPLNFPFVVE